MTENERREFLKAAGASLAGVVGFGVLGCSTSSTQDSAKSPDNEATERDKAKKREELTERLKKLGEEEPPKEIDETRVMCYDIAFPEDWYQQ